MTLHVPRGSKLKLIICVVLTLALFLWMNGYVFTELTGAGARNIAFSTVIYSLAAAALLSAVIATPIWAALAMIIFGLNLLIAASFSKVMGHAMSLPEAQMLFNVSDNKADVLSALSQFGPIVTSVFVAVTLLIALLIWARSLASRRTNIPLFVLSIAVTLSYGIRFLLPGVVVLPGNFTPSVDASALVANLVIESVSSKDRREAKLDRVRQIRPFGTLCSSSTSPSKARPLHRCLNKHARITPETWALPTAMETAATCRT